MRVAEAIWPRSLKVDGYRVTCKSPDRGPHCPLATSRLTLLSRALVLFACRAIGVGWPQSCPLFFHERWSPADWTTLRPLSTAVGSHCCTVRCWASRLRMDRRIGRLRTFSEPRSLSAYLVPPIRKIPAARAAVDLLNPHPASCP